MNALAGLSRRKPSAPLKLPRRFGRYRLTRLLAVGGMAQIYLAKSFGAEGFVKPLVIKRLDPDLANNPQLTSLFINEAKLLVTLNHGNIVPVFDFGRVNDDLFMAMEYVRGISVRALLETLGGQQRQLDHQLAAHIAGEVCKGLDYAHRKSDVHGRPAGIIHRDIKPNNILISQEGEVKIVDFGVAKLAGRVEHERRLAGTLAYMSPEQAERQIVDPRTDIFSTGLVLHEMLSGRRAYDGSGPLEVLAMAVKGELPPLPDEVPAELKEIVNRAALRDPADRYATAHEMEQALAEFLLLARSAGSTMDSVSPASRLAELLRELPIETVDESFDEVDLEVPAPVEAALDPEDTEPEVVLSAADLSRDEPDLELIHDAAETFHSEFLTRVLQEEQEGVQVRRRWPLLAAGVGALVVAGIMLAFVLWPSERPGGAERARPDGPDAPSSATDLVITVSAPDSGARPPRRKIRRRRYGHLHLNSIPWSRVTVDGRRLKRPTPVVGLRLRAGWHRVVLENRELRLRKKIRIYVRAGATTRKLVRLR
jgi:serine/threonine protein kinase